MNETQTTQDIRTQIKAAILLMTDEQAALVLAMLKEELKGKE